MANNRINIATGFYQSDSVPFVNQRCVNLYPNIPQAQAISQASLFGTEGLREVAVTSYSAKFACRGGIEFQNKPHFVCGENLYEVEKIQPVIGDAVYRVNFIGIVDGNGGRVSMAENGDQLLIVNDIGEGFIYQPNGSPSFSIILDAGFYANGTPKIVRYVDRYFIVSTDQKKAIISAVGDGTNWNAIDSISAEADPDDLVAPFIHKNQLYLLGSQTTEQFQNIGGAGVPFRRVNGFVVPVGCSASFSVINVGDVVYWVGRGEKEKAGIWAFNGGQPQKISTIAIENKLHDLSLEQLQSIFSFAYSQKGNTFINFSTPFATFVFNPVTGLWHERESQVTLSTGGREAQRCRISVVIDAFNDLLAGDLKDGRIGILDENEFTEYDEPYIAYFTTQPLYNNSNSFTLPQIELVCETGVGNELAPDPKVRMQISRDGTLFENPRTRELGRIGNRAIRPIWYKNGRISAIGSFKVTVSDPVKRAFYSMDITLKPTRGSV